MALTTTSNNSDIIIKKKSDIKKYIHNLFDRTIRRFHAYLFLKIKNRSLFSVMQSERYVYSSYI